MIVCYGILYLRVHRWLMVNGVVDGPEVWTKSARFVCSAWHWLLYLDGYFVLGKEMQKDDIMLCRVREFTWNSDLWLARSSHIYICICILWRKGSFLRRGRPRVFLFSCDGRCTSSWPDCWAIRQYGGRMGRTATAKQRWQEDEDDASGGEFYLHGDNRFITFVHFFCRWSPTWGNERGRRYCSIQGVSRFLCFRLLFPFIRIECIEAIRSRILLSKLFVLGIGNRWNQGKVWSLIFSKSAGNSDEISHT